MKYIYVCRAVPEAVCNFKKLSVAGNRFSLNMAKALNNVCGDNVRFISLSHVERRLIDKLHADEIWNGKSYQQIKSGKYILVSEFVQAFRLFCVKVHNTDLFLLQVPHIFHIVVCDLIRLGKSHGLPACFLFPDAPGKFPDT